MGFLTQRRREPRETQSLFIRLHTIQQFYDFTGGLNPLQVIPADIEKFYDSLMEKVDRNTVYLHIAGLKKFFENVKAVIPFFQNPFNIMDKELKRKLNRTRKARGTKKALSKQELQNLLSFLSEDKSLKGKQNYAIVLFLVTSGIRAADLCGLRWGDIQEYEGKPFAVFIGKGGKQAEQELYPAAIEAAKEAYKIQFKCDPRKEDHIFNCLESSKGKPITGISKPVLWYQLKDIYKQVKDAGIIKRDVVFSVHLFRRTYCTLLFKAGLDLKSLQYHSRHSNIETLTKHYIDSAEGVKDYIDKILIL